ncbi:MAG: glycosyltransferase [Actinomycetota bacterium]
MSASPARPVKACHLIHDLGPGGAEHVLVDLASVAAEAGMEMSVVSMMPLGALRYPQRLREAGVDVRSLELRAWWDPRGPRRLSGLIADLVPDVLHSHLKHADVVAGRVAVGVGVPHVSTLHVVEDQVVGLAARKRNLAARSRMRSAAVTIAVSDALRAWYLATFPERPDRVVTIRNGVPAPLVFDETDRTAVRAELGIPPEAVVATMVGVVRPGKGHDVLLRAAAHVDGVVFLIAGDGPEMATVRRLAAALPPGRVVLAGFWEDVSRLLAASDLVVQPSRFDALPTTLIHALAAGIPAVASKVGGIPEIVAPGTGMLVPPGDPDLLAAAVRSLAGDADARRWMGKAARERFDQEFDGARWAGRLVALYRSLSD